MKKTILFLILFIAASTLHAQSPVVVVQSPASVTVDGQPFGAVADAIANNAQLASAIQRALQKWSDDKDAAATVTQSALTDAQAKITAYTQSLQSINATLSGTGSPNSMKVATVMPVVTDALKSEKDKEIAKAQADLAAAQAKIDALSQ